MPPAEPATSKDPKERLIVALDVDSSVAARNLVAELRDVVGAFKIGLQLFTAAGPNLVREFTTAGHRVFLDLKFHDIPNTAANAGVAVAKLGVWMFNLHAVGGSEMMRATSDLVTEFCSRDGVDRPKIIAVTILTSSDANVLREVGIERDVEMEVVSLAQLAAKCGLDGVVTSSMEAKAIKDAVNAPFLVVTPGIRPASATIDDQKRVSTPAAAISAGADYLVIGRPITGAKDRQKAAVAIADEISFSSDKIP